MLMKKLSSFVKQHKLLTVIFIPLAVLLVMWGVLLPCAYFDLLPGIENGPLRSLSTSLFVYCIIFYPFVLTAVNFCYLFQKHSHGSRQTGVFLFELISIPMGLFLSWFYITEVSYIEYADWPEVLRNSQVHSPIATWTMPTILTFTVLGVIGYLILRLVPLKKLPPLMAVLSMSAMYAGCILCALWIIQTVRSDLEGIYLSLFPFNCILIVIRVVIQVIRQWKGCVEEQADRNETMSWLKRALMNSSNWPWLAFLFMIPLLGIAVMILLLFGQAPDSLIQAWTQTSDWRLSQQISPPNVIYDEHYLCTVAAGGHKSVVKPLRMGVRHGHRVVVNRQLCIANAFEQILEERLPSFHRVIRHFYDTCGYPIARHIKSQSAADVIYVLMKPLEWIFLLVIYLCDAKPENRIAMQYISPMQ